ncbi:MAG: AAA family ATPase [Intrasporangiaceae bacterium]|nr:AAA family ATPase [Intrasporangiaceae bacterium]
MAASRSVPDEARSVAFNPQDVDTHADFAALLTEARLNAGLSIREVARRTSTPVSTLGGYFGGRHLPAPNRPEILRDLLTAMSVPPDDHDRWERALRRAFQGRRSGTRMASPYPGLRAYQSGDAETFFGRDQATQALLTTFHRSHRESDLPIVVVTGASGSGKSSLLRAGLMPSLEDWDIAVIEPGADPIAQLRLLEPEDPRRPACLLIDQGEGLWSKADVDGRAAFLEHVSTWVRPSPRRDGSGPEGASEDAPPRVAVFGIRADFYSQAADHDSLRTALQQNHYILAPLTSAELAEVIVEPARLAGVTVRPDLVSAIVHEALSSQQDTGTFLPHVAHCLSRMWTQREGPELTLDLYEKTGGISAVMRESAESTWLSLDESERPVARRLLLAMVETYPGLPRTSRSVLIDELSETEQSIVDTFAGARVVSVVEDSASLAHEAIITAWPRLRAWIEDDLERLTLVRRLEREADAWIVADRDDDLLLRGTRLLGYQDLADEEGDDVGPREAEFLAASRNLANQEEAARAKRQRQQTTLLLLVSGLAVAALVAVLGYVNANRQLGMERDAAASRQLAALSAEAGETSYVTASGLALAALSTADTVEATSAVLASSALGDVTRLTGPIGQRMVTGSPDGRILAASDAGGQIVIYDVTGDRVTETTRLEAPQSDGEGTVFALQFSPDGRFLAAGGTSGSVRVIDLSEPGAPGEPVDLPAGGTVYALAWPDDTTLYAGTQNPGLLRWERAGDTFESAAARSPSTAMSSSSADGTASSTACHWKTTHSASRSS